MKAVILAGGKGTRLLPRTACLPKAMMPINGRPVLEIIINRLQAHGLVDIILATGHLENVIRAHFRDGSAYGVDILYSKEEFPLGTGGPLRLVKGQLRETFLVMNGDILTDLNLSRLIECHRGMENTATIVVVQRDMKVEFGVVQIEPDGSISEWREKPIVGYPVNAGVYVFEPEALTYLPESDCFGLPDFVLALVRHRRRVRAYRHEGYWLDIGRHEDYEKACREFERFS